MRILTAVIFVLLFAVSQAQELSDVKFGKLSAKDFDLPHNKLTDSSAAVIIADIGSTEFLGNTDGWFSLQFTRKMRARINTQAGVDVADFQLVLYGTGADKEDLRVKRAAAYSIVDGDVVSTELEKKQVFTEKYDANRTLVKFSIPGAQPGAIVEVEYVLISKFLNSLQGWEFQGAYPRLWSAYDVAIPEFFNYAFLSQGYLAFHDKTQKVSSQRYNITSPGTTVGSASRNVSITGGLTIVNWVIKNAPALKEEQFTTSINNHISKIDFQLTEIRLPDQRPEPVLDSWQKLSERLNKNEFFGLNLYKNNAWLNSEVEPLVASLSDKSAKIKAIFDYVRTRYTCTSYSGLYLDTNLKDVVKKKSGTVADINLLLIAMLDNAGIEAYPIVLSTRSHGYTNALYPMLDRFNYVICTALPNGNTAPVLLDASEPNIAFGKLPLRCYNGHARIITPTDAVAISLDPETIKEKSVVTLYAVMDSNNNWKGKIKEHLGYYESLDWRDEIKTNGEKDIVAARKKEFPDEFVNGEITLANVQIPDTSIVAEVNLDFTSMLDEDIIYLDPFPGKQWKDNPFNAAERLYPVEMPYTMDQLYAATWQIPAGYVVDDLPKSARIKFNDDEGMYEYLIQASPTSIMLRNRLVIDKANFSAEDYSGLRDFFNYVITKNSEKIVLKKKANP